MVDSYVSLRGLRFHVVSVDGPAPDAPAVVLLHGHASNARSWDFAAAALANRYHVFAVDARGHGDSAWSPEGAYALDDRVDDVVAFLDAMGLASATLVGASMGGRTAYNVAASSPARVDRLVVIDVAPTLDPAGTARIAAATGGASSFANLDDAFRSLRSTYGASVPDVAIRQRALTNTMRIDDGTYTWRYDPNQRAAPPPPGFDDEQWAMLAGITAPTLLVRGGDSDLLQRADAERFVSTVVDGRLVEIPGAGHAVGMDQPALLLRALLDFLF